jgi:hypothetical protein
MTRASIPRPFVQTASSQRCGHAQTRPGKPSASPKSKWTRSNWCRANPPSPRISSRAVAPCRVLRSPHAHARIKNIDASKAKELKGVAAVLTWQDIPRVVYSTAGQSDPIPGPLDTFSLDNKVRFVGRPRGDGRGGNARDRGKSPGADRSRI